MGASGTGYGQEPGPAAYSHGQMGANVVSPPPKNQPNFGDFQANQGQNQSHFQPNMAPSQQNSGFYPSLPPHMVETLKQQIAAGLEKGLNPSGNPALNPAAGFLAKPEGMLVFNQLVESYKKYYTEAITQHAINTGFMQNNNFAVPNQPVYQSQPKPSVGLLGPSPMTNHLAENKNMSVDAALAAVLGKNLPPGLVNSSNQQNHNQEFMQIPTIGSNLPGNVPAILQNAIRIPVSQNDSISINQMGQTTHNPSHHSGHGTHSGNHPTPPPNFHDPSIIAASGNRSNFQSGSSTPQTQILTHQNSNDKHNNSNPSQTHSPSMNLKGKIGDLFSNNTVLIQQNNIIINQKENSSQNLLNPGTGPSPNFKSEVPVETNSQGQILGNQSPLAQEQFLGSSNKAIKYEASSSSKNSAKKLLKKEPKSSKKSGKIYNKSEEKVLRFEGDTQ